MLSKALSAAFVRSAQPGRYCDGDGLYLLVKKTGTKFWIYRFKPKGGKPREMGLGRAGEARNCVMLAEAREKASVLFKQVKAGIDPLQARDASIAATKAAAVKAVTFREAAKRFIAGHAASWKNAKHANQWTATLTRYAYPLLGDLPVSAIETAHVLAVLEPVWSTKTETASRLRGRIEAILDYAKTHGWRSGENPAAWKGRLSLALPARSKVSKVEHHAALSWKQVGNFMSQLAAQKGIGASALQFAILTAARSGEVRGATWREVDLSAALWIIPAERMKAGREHRVPLSAPSVAILQEAYEARASNNPDAFIFTGQDGKRPLSDMSLTAVLKRMDRKDLTVHGFRSTFRDWAAETTAYPAELAEMALAHAIGSKVEAAYRRGDLLEKRRRLMADWATHCELAEEPVGGNVLLLRGG